MRTHVLIYGGQAGKTVMGSDTHDSNSERFAHEALFYAGQDDFVAQLTPFIREGVERDEPVLVVVNAAKIERLREELGAHAEDVRFADMAKVGSNPARIIPAWHEFVEGHAREGRPVRGVGEPITPDRCPEALAECVRHEALLNLAFAHVPAFRLVCPYDTEALEPNVIAEAERTHPALIREEGPEPSPAYMGLDAVVLPFDQPLPEPRTRPEGFAVTVDRLDAVRRLVSDHAGRAELDDAKVAEFVLAVNEIATNSVRHGGGGGWMRIWTEDVAVVCEVRDDGRIVDPLAGRTRPEAGREDGYGLWMVNQLCDLVQIRTFETGSVVRLHMLRSSPAAAAS